MPNTYSIQSTTDYSAFKRIDGNRPVRSAHVKKLRDAIEKKPQTIKYNPILINDKWEIIDGQHRVEALEQLGMPVHFVVVDGLGLQDVQKLNSIAKQWQPLDYAMAFAELGNENYALYVKVKKDEKVSLNHDSLVRYLSLDEPFSMVSFNIGDFVVPDFNESIRLLTQLHEIGPFYDSKRFKTRPFALAYLKMVQDERYDHKRMLYQMKEYGHLLEDRANEVGYFKELNRIYNWQKGNKNKIYFGTPEYLQEK